VAGGGEGSMNPDFTVRNEGSIFLLTPHTPEAITWLKSHVSADSQWFGDSLVVEHRYIEDLVLGIRSEGFSIQ
jgi:hypothetical protein